MNDNLRQHPDYPGYGISKDGRVYSFKSDRWLTNKAKHVIAFVFISVGLVIGFGYTLLMSLLAMK